MKKVSLMIAMLLVFSVAVWAQGGSGGSGGTGGAAGGSGGAAGSRGSGSGASMPTGPDTSQNPTGTGNNSTSPDDTRGRAHEKTMEGCLVQSGSDWFLATKDNKKFIRLNLGTKSSSDFSALANQRVKVRGTESSGGAMSSNAGAGDNSANASAGTAGTGAGVSAGASTTGGNASTTASGNTGAAATTGTPDTTATASGNQTSASASAGGNTAQSSAGQTSGLPQSGSSSTITVDPSKVADKNLTVSNIEPASGTCSATGSSDKHNKSDNK